MKTKTVLTTILLSSSVVALASPVFAEDPAVVGNPTDIVVESPVKAPVTNPTPVVPIAEQPIVPEEPIIENPIDPAVPKPSVSKEVTEPVIPGQPVEPVKENNNAESEPTKQDESTTKPVTSKEQPIESVGIQVDTVSAEVPVITQGGHKIIGTQDGQVLIDNGQGQTEVKTPEEIGGKRLSDGRIEVRDKDNKLTVLPSTGENRQSFLLFLGITILGFLLFCYRKSFKRSVKDH